MTNYHAYLKGHALGFGPSKGELKLRVARQSEDLKKIVEAMNSLLRAKNVDNCISHLEGEEIFRSMKRKLDVSIGDARDSYRLDKVNFSQPHIQTRFVAASFESSEGKEK